LKKQEDIFMNLLIDKLIKELKAYNTKNKSVFNPWTDFDSNCDFSSSAPKIRENNLKEYLNFLKSRRKVKLIIVAEAMGYKGGKFTGIPLTSERLLLNKHRYVKVGGFTKSNFHQTSIKSNGFSEPTSTILWDLINSNNINIDEFLLWNIFPFHPYKRYNKCSNRTPLSSEIEEGGYYLKLILKIWPQVSIVGIGKKSQNYLTRHRIEHHQVTHPANGRKAQFVLDFQNALLKID
ncbi:uracil-DNA glycosylase, partial [Bacillus amyloliquefaciens]